MVELNKPPCSVCGAPSVGFVTVEGNETRFHKAACGAHMGQVKDEGTLINLEQIAAPQGASVVDPATNKQF